MMKRSMTVVLVLMMLLISLVPSAVAAPSEAGCEKSPNGKHSWAPRPRDAWCDYAGGYVWTCTYCRKHVFEETTPALGHNWPAWTQTKAATCTEKGSRTRTCNRCHKVETQAIAALGHYYPNPWTTVKEPTCEEAGQEVNYCVRCNYEWRRELEAIGHDWDEGVVTKEPTAYEEGEMTYTCKNDPSHTKTEPIPATIGLTSSTVRIVWNDDDDAAGLRPSEVRVDFKQTNYVMEETTTVVTLNSNNGWTATMSDLPKQDEDGNTFSYLWAEHTDDLPQVYKLISMDIEEDNTVFTNAYFASLSDPHPALELSVEVGGVTSDSYSYNDYYSTYIVYSKVYTQETVTNTGNTPLDVWHVCWFNNDSSDIDMHARDTLLPGEQLPEKGESYMIYESETSSDDPKHWSFMSKIIETPDDPQYLGYCTISVCYYGYDPNLGEDAYGSTPLCQSNVVTFTVYVPREVKKEEILPTLDVVKVVANQPEDLEYFHEGEEVKWGLTVTNTSNGPITEVTVDDKGTIVGNFETVEPEQTLPCNVPSETVTEYEAKVVGYITNYAMATGKDEEGGEHSWPSNVATAPTKKLTDEDDPLGQVYGLKVAASITKEEAHGPLNGKYFDLNETIDYVITVKNTGEEALKDVTVTDSLNGDTPIDTLGSLAPGEEKEFTFSHTVTQNDIDHHWVVNLAMLTYTFGDNIGGTPRSSNKVYSKAGEGDGPVEHFDPEKLPKDVEHCSLSLDALNETEARYTLHSCAYHLTTLADAEASAAEGDWKEAAEIWYSAILELYGHLYEAGDSEAKAAVTEDRALFIAYAEKYAAAVNTQDAKEMREETEKLYDLFLGTARDENRKNQLIAERDAMFKDVDAYEESITGEALIRMLRLKCALLCYCVSTMPEHLQSSLSGEYEVLEEMEAHETSAREFSDLSGDNCTVIEYYDALASRAMQDVRSILKESGYGSLDRIFLRGQSFWQATLDEELKPLYLEADEVRKQDIGAWRVTLDSLLPGERNLLTLMYPEAPEIPEEMLMDLYRDAVLFVESIR